MIIPVFFSFCFVLTFPYASYVAWGDWYPLFYAQNALLTQLYTWTNTISFWSVSGQVGYLLIQPVVYILSFFIQLWGDFFAQYFYYLSMFVLAPLGMYFLLRMLDFSKNIALQGAFFYGLSFLLWAGLTRNTLHITNFFVFTSWIVGLIQGAIQMNRAKYYFWLLLVGILNVFVAVNPWTIGIQLMLIFFFALIKIKNIKQGAHFVKALLFSYFFGIIGVLTLFMLLFNSANIQKDDWNNVVLKEWAMNKERQSSSIINTMRGLNWDFFDFWWYVDYHKSDEFYTPFPYAKLYKTDFFQVLSFVPLFLLILGLTCSPKKNKIWIWLFALFLISVLLIKGVGQPFGGRFEYCLNEVPMCGIFRSPHQKFSLVYLFALIFALAYLRKTLLSRRYKIAFDILLWAYILIMGSFHFFYPYISRQNILKDIPPAYKQATHFIENNKDIKNILTLPFNESTWINTEFWFEGYHLLSYLLPKHQIYNRNDLAFSSFAAQIHEILWPEINKRGEKTLEYMDTYYIDTLIYDAYTDRYTRFAHKEEHEENIRRLDSLTGLSKLGTYDKIHIYHRTSSAILQTSGFLSYLKINPIKYRLSIKSLSWSQELSFLQSYHPQRKLYPSKISVVCETNKQLKYNSYQYLTRENIGESRMQQTWTGNITECVNEDYVFFEGEELKYLWKKPVFDETHQLVNEYANGRSLDADYIKQNFPKEYYKENPDGSIDVNLTLYFKPQSYFYLGLGISGLIFVGLIAWLIIDRRREKK